MHGFWASPSDLAPFHTGHILACDLQGFVPSGHVISVYSIHKPVCTWKVFSASFAKKNRKDAMASISTIKHITDYQLKIVLDIGSFYLNPQTYTWMYFVWIRSMMQSLSERNIF